LDVFLLVLFLLFLAFLPVLLAILWFRHKNFHFKFPFFLIFLGGGVVSVLLALVFQAFIPQIEETTKKALIFNVFVRTSLSEESARLIVFLVIFRFKDFLGSKTLKSGEFYTPAVLSGGLLAGLAFAAVESAYHAFSDSKILIVRAFSSIPLHGACGIRCCLAADGILGGESNSKASAGINFVFAVLIHSLYDFMLPQSNLFTALAVLLSITALISSLQSQRHAPPAG